MLDLGQASGDPTYLDLAEELMRSCLRKLWDAPAGAFVDRLSSSAGAGDVGLLADPYRPFALNAEAARLLERLGRQTGHDEFLARAADLRRWLDRSYSAQGISSAEYGLVVLDLTDAAETGTEATASARQGEQANRAGDRTAAQRGVRTTDHTDQES
jgi:uncharacterized protein YyaL (SSP411 family)